MSMDMRSFIDCLKLAKPSQICTGFYNIKVMGNHEHTKMIIYKVEKCKTCGRINGKFLKMEFGKPHQLTVFEAEMLFLVFCLKRRPADYAGWHKCEAGKEFIRNIKHIAMA